MESSNSVGYKRGPYKQNKDNLYRSKATTSGGDTSRDAEAFSTYLKSIREDIKNRFQISYNRGKVLENIQGLLDCLAKQIRYKENKQQKRIEELEELVEQLSKRLAEHESQIITPEMISNMLNE